MTMMVDGLQNYIFARAFLDVYLVKGFAGGMEIAH
jgi:hypothetical protein